MGLEKDVAKIGKLSTVYMLGMIAPQVIGLVLLRVFTSYLDPAQMDITMLANRLATPIGVFVQLGLWSALKMHYFRTAEADRARLVRTVLLGQLVQGIALCCVLSVVGLWVADALMPNLPLGRKYVLILWLMTVWSCLFVAILQMATGVLQLLERAAASVGLNLLGYVFQAGLGVAAVVGLGWQGFGRYGTTFIASVLAAIVSFRVVWRLGGAGFDFPVFKRMLRTGLTFVPHALSGLLALTIGSWLLAKLDPGGSLAIYGIAVGFVQLVDLPMFSFGNAAYPTLARLMSDGSREAMRQQARLYTLLVIAVVALNLGVYLFAPTAIWLLTAPKYHGAMALVGILVFGWMFSGMYLIVSQPVFFFGGGLWLAMATASSTVVSVALAICLIPRYGMYGAAWSMVGSHATAFVVASMASYYLYRLPWQVSHILRIFAGAAALCLLNVWLSPKVPVGWDVPIKMLIFAGLLPALWLTGAVTAAEIRWAGNLGLTTLRSFVPILNPK